MDYKKSYRTQKGYTKLCAKGECSLEQLEFGILELGPKEGYVIDTRESETAFVILEEHYYFLFQPEQGFAIQKLYTKDGSIDETYTVRPDELAEFPRGYHTTVSALGYNTYFLWVMAGEHQGFSA